MRVDEVKPKIAFGKRKKIAPAKDFDKQFGKLLRRDCKKILKVYYAMNKFKQLKRIVNDKEELEYAADGHNFYFLYRGTKRKNPAAYLANPPTNRRPKDTTEILQKELNSVFRLAGISATRGNSIFVSGSTSVAYDYGAAYIIFPIDGFHYSWSSKHEDLFSGLLDDMISLRELIGERGNDVSMISSDFADYMQELVNDINDLHHSFPKKIPNLKKGLNTLANLIERLERLNDRNGDLEELYYQAKLVVKGIWKNYKDVEKGLKTTQKFLATLKKNELVIKKSLGEDFIDDYKSHFTEVQATLRKLMRYYPSIYKLIKNLSHGSDFTKYEAKKIIDKMGIVSDTGLDKAIRSGNEIVLTGPYYAFKYDKYAVDILAWMARNA